MLRANLPAFGTIAATAIITMICVSAANAEPYGGFDSVRRPYIHIDYGPRYEAKETTVRYVDLPAQASYRSQVSYRYTYTRPVTRTTKVVYDAPVVGYVTPVRYRRVYAAPRRVLRVSPAVHFAGYYDRHHPRSYHRQHGVLRHFRPHRYFRHHRHHGYHPRGWGLSIGSAPGYRGRHGGFSFYYNR